jgi:CTP-dependent riboflavin kinase
MLRQTETRQRVSCDEGVLSRLVGVRGKTRQNQDINFTIVQCYPLLTLSITSHILIPQAKSYKVVKFLQSFNKLWMCQRF